MKRPLIIAAAAAAMMLTIAACGSSSSSSASSSSASTSSPATDQPITLSFLSYNYGTPDTGGKGTQALLDAFKAAHPNITIKPEGVAIADALTKAQTETAAGQPPDVAQLGWSKLGGAYDNLPIVPVQSIPSAADWASTTQGFSQPILKATEHKGQVAAMPYTLSTPTLFYNATLFQKAGLDPANPPTTITQAQSDGLAIAKTGASGVYFDIANAAKSDFLTQSVIDANGGSVVSSDGKLTLDQPAAVQALTAMQQLTKSGAQPAVSETDAIAAFKAGKLGMLVTSTALLASLESASANSFDLRTAGMPGFAGKPVHTTFSGAGLVVLSKDKAHQQAAWEFIKFLTSAQGFTIITSQIGYLPLRPGIVHDAQYLAPYYAKDPRIGPALTQLDSVTPYTFFNGKNATQAVTALQDDAVAPIVLQGADPASTLAKVAQEIHSLTGQ